MAFGLSSQRVQLGLAMVLWMYLLTRLDVSQASVSIYLLPFLGVLISASTLKERITLTMIVGGIITVAGTAIVTISEQTVSGQTSEPREIGTETRV